MSDLPLVTIVVISYNQGKFIRENLDSIKAQTYPNIELILADDASEDNSVEVFSQWLTENSYPALYNFHKLNTGLATVLNECVTLATGRYIKLIAADDYLHPESIEKCVAKLEELGEEYGMVSSDTFCIDEYGNIQGDFADFNSIQDVAPRDLKDLLILGNRLSTLTVLMRTAVLRETGEYHTEFVVEDYQRWLMISEKYYIAYIPQKLAFYRLHPGNTSKARAERIIQEDRMLQMMFDRKGIAKHYINDFVHWSYVWKKPMPTEMMTLFNRYPYRIKTLNLFIQNNIPPIFFKVLYSIALRLHFKLP